MPWHNITSRQAHGRAMPPDVAMVLTKEEDGDNYHPPTADAVPQGLGRPLRYAPGTAKPLRNQPPDKWIKLCLSEKAVPRE